MVAIDLTEIVIALLGVTGTIITSYLIPYIREKYNKEELEKVISWCRIAVNASEQLAKSGAINLDDRKEYAMKKVLNNKGIKLNIEQISDIIESMVLEIPKNLTESEKDL